MKDVQAADDLAVLSKMERELRRIENLGGFEKDSANRGYCICIQRKDI